MKRQARNNSIIQEQQCWIRSRIDAVRMDELTIKSRPVFLRFPVAEYAEYRGLEDIVDEEENGHLFIGRMPTHCGGAWPPRALLRQRSSSSPKLAPTSGFFHANFFRPPSRRILSRRKTVRRVSSQLSWAGIYPFRDVCVRWCFRINPLAGRVDLSVLLLCQSSLRNSQT